MREAQVTDDQGWLIVGGIVLVGAAALILANWDRFWARCQEGWMWCESLKKCIPPLTTCPIDIPGPESKNGSVTQPTWVRSNFPLARQIVPGGS